MSIQSQNRGAQAIASGKNTGSYAQMYQEQQQRIIHLKETPAKLSSARKPSQSQQHQQQSSPGPSHTTRPSTSAGRSSTSKDGYFSYPPEESIIKTRKPGSTSTPSRSQQQQHQRPQTAAPRANSPSPSPSSSPTTNQQSSTSRPPAGPPRTTWIAGFPGMDADSKTAAGSGGEKTLRHRLFPFHDIPSDGDPHRAMHRVATNPTLEEARIRNYHGINVINAPFVDPQPMYSKPPPNRTVSEFDKLLAPEVYATPLDQPSYENSTKYKPRYDPSQPLNRAEGSGLTAREMNSRPLQGEKYYDDIFQGRARPMQTQRIQQPPYDTTRAGWHSADAQQSQKRKGLKMVPQYQYTSASLASDYSAVTPFSGQMVLSTLEAQDVAARVNGRPLPDSGIPAGQPSVMGHEKRPGAKQIRQQTLQAKRSDNVAKCLMDATHLPPEELNQRPLLSEHSMKLNYSGRQKDFDHSTSYDIITLAGSDRPTNADKSSGDTAGMSSRERDGYDYSGRGWNGRGLGSGTGPTASSTRIPPNQISHLDSRCAEIPSSESAPPQKRHVASYTRNDSLDMWNLLTQRK